MELTLARRPPTLSAPRIYTETDLRDADYHGVAAGAAVVYTHRSPTKDSCNEDALALIPVPGGGVVLAVADGLGGLPAGEAAARLAIESLRDAVSAAPRRGMVVRDAILNGIERANAAIIADGLGSATTLIVVEIQGALIRSYHVGDSLALVTGQRGRLKFQTVPHSPVGYAMEAGLLAEADAMHHAERNIVSNVIGSAEMRIDIGPTVTLAAHDTLILASDGVPDNLYISELTDCIRAGPLRRVARHLIARCGARMQYPQAAVPSHPDDLSFIVYRPFFAAALDGGPAGA